jgi:hypothetical protein
LHASNTVPESKLHAFLASVHWLLWVPLTTLFVTVVTSSVVNGAATLILYRSWIAFGVRLGVSVAWVVLVALMLAAISRSASRFSHPLRPFAPPRAAVVAV